MLFDANSTKFHLAGKLIYCFGDLPCDFDVVDKKFAFQDHMLEALHAAATIARLQNHYNLLVLQCLDYPCVVLNSLKQDELLILLLISINLYATAPLSPL